MKARVVVIYKDGSFSSSTVHEFDQLYMRNYNCNVFKQVVLTSEHCKTSDLKPKIIECSEKELENCRMLVQELSDKLYKDEIDYSDFQKRIEELAHDNKAAMSLASHFEESANQVNDEFNTLHAKYKELQTENLVLQKQIHKIGVNESALLKEISDLKIKYEAAVQTIKTVEHISVKFQA
jgi:uncharacterized protein YdiU (UPF0061 family)